MAWFQNKQTGLKWEVADEELIKRLQQDENYLVVDTLQEETTLKNKNTKAIKAK